MIGIIINIIIITNTIIKIIWLKCIDCLLMITKNISNDFYNNHYKDDYQQLKPLKEDANVVDIISHVNHQSINIL